MKNQRILPLIILTFGIFTFTLGLFIGRNYVARDISLSFPEEMTNIPVSVPVQNEATVSASGPLLDINQASYQELMTLPGVGEGLALEIIAYRAECGGFSHVEELMNVSGIGEKRLEALLHLITVGGTP